jgi:hypothetical protein
MMDQFYSGHGMTSFQMLKSECRDDIDDGQLRTVESTTPA